MQEVELLYWFRKFSVNNAPIAPFLTSGILVYFELSTLILPIWDDHSTSLSISQQYITILTTDATVIRQMHATLSHRIVKYVKKSAQNTAYSMFERNTYEYVKLDPVKFCPGYV